MREAVKGAGTAKAARVKARRGLERAEAGDVAGARQVEDARRADRPDTEAAEQEAADGPKGVGLAR